MGQVYDLNALRKYHPFIASHEDYLRMINEGNVTTYPMCNARPTGNPPMASLCGGVENFFKERKNNVLEMAVKRGKGVIDIRSYRKDGFLRTRVEGTGGDDLVDEGTRSLVIRDYFEFHPDHFATVEKLLKLMGVNNSTYNVIHWRAEVQNSTAAAMDFNACANKILAARRIMSPNNETPTVLMSSLNTMTKLQWKRHAGQEQAVASLERLMDAGLHKIDEVRSNVDIPDMVVLAIWDQIMAARANKFTTCATTCGRDDPCAACSYQGNFAQMAIDLRNDHGKTSEECWPRVDSR